MEIILVCKHSSGQAALPAKRIGGHLAPERQYHIHNHKVALSGHPDKVLKSDAQELLDMPDELYRMPTPKEQEEWAKAEQETNQIQESEQGEEKPSDEVPPEQGEQDDSSDLEDDEEESAQDIEQKEGPAPTVPPALQEKPKRHYNRKKY